MSTSSLTPTPERRPHGDRAGFQPGNFGYRVFISYARADSEFVDELFGLLNTYRTPRPLMKRRGRYGLPPWSFRVFLDRKGAEAGGTVSARIREKLEDSAFLVVVCSKSSVDRPWVNEEIAIFSEVAGPERIVPVLLRENRDTPLEEVVPPALLALGSGTPMGADVALDGMRAVRDKVLGAVLGFAQDQIAREQDIQDARARRRTRAVLTTISVLLVVVVIAAMYAFHQRDEAEARLIALRVDTGTQAALDGDVWGAWDWYADALALARKAGADEERHRQRLASLRSQMPLVEHFRFEDADVFGVLVSPDERKVAILTERRETGSSHVKMLDTVAYEVVSDMELGNVELVDLRFAGGSEDIRVTYRATKDGSDVRELVSDLRSSESGDVLASRAWPEDTQLHFADGEPSAVRLPPLGKGEHVRATSADGSWLATINWVDAQLRVHALDSSRGPFVIPFGDDGRPVEVDFDQWGRVLVTEETDDDGLISTLWHVGSKRPEQVFDHDEPVTRWEFPRDPRGGAAAGTGVGATRIRRPPLRHAIFSANGGRLLTRSKRSQSFRIWDVASARPITPPISHGESRLRAVAFAPSARFVVSAAADGSVRVTDVALPRYGFAPIGQPAGVESLAFHPTEPAWLLAVSDGKARIFDWEAGVELAAVGEQLEDARFDLAGTRLFGRSSDGFQVWDADALENEALQFHHEDLDGAELSERGRYVLSWSQGFSKAATLRMTDVVEGKVVVESTIDRDSDGSPGAYVRAAVVSERLGRAYFSVRNRGADREELVVLEFGRGEEATMELHPVQSRISGFARFRPDCVSAFDGRRFSCVDALRTGPAPQLDEEPGALTKLLAAQPDGSIYVVTDVNEKLARAFDASTGEAISPEFRHEWAIEVGQVSRDGRTLLTVSGNKVHLWDLESGQPVIPSKGYPDTVVVAALGPDERVVAVASRNELDGSPFTLFLEAVRGISGDIAELVGYGTVNGGFRVDRLGGRIPATARVLDGTWNVLDEGGRGAMLGERSLVEWLRQGARETRNARQKIMDLEAIVALEPSDVEARVELADLHGALQQHEPALAHHKTLVEQGYVDAWKSHSDVLLSLGRYDEAIGVLSRSVAEHPNLVELRLRRAKVRWMVGKLDEAFADYEAVEAQGGIAGERFVSYAILAAASGEGDAYARNCGRALDVARRGSSPGQGSVESWNAAILAAQSCELQPTTTSELVDAVALMVANVAQNEDVASTLALYRALLRLIAGDLDQAIELAARRGDDLMAHIIEAGARARRGEREESRRILRRVTEGLRAREFTAHYELITKMQVLMRTYATD